jgi:hypothetical protein
MPTETAGSPSFGTGSRVEMHFAGTDDQVLVDVELDGIDESLETRATLLLDLCSRYRLTPEAS